MRRILRKHPSATAMVKMGISGTHQNRPPERRRTPEQTWRCARARKFYPMLTGDVTRSRRAGFGRIGRLVCRAACEKEGAEVTAVNDPFCDVKYAAYLFKYDSTHGIYKGTVDFDEVSSTLIVDGKPIKFFAVRNPNEVPWGDSGADIVCESTGIFTVIEKASMHIQGGCKKVIIVGELTAKEKAQLHIRRSSCKKVIISAMFSSTSAAIPAASAATTLAA